MSLIVPIAVGIGAALAWKILRSHLPGRCNKCGEKTTLVANFYICYKCNLRFRD